MHGIKNYKLSELKVLGDNPRIIDSFKYQTLVTSLKEFPEMLLIRPLLIDEELNILCGNMRFRAANEIGMETIPARVVVLSAEQKKELIIKDNVSFGEWDDEGLEKHWDKEMFNKWLGFETFDYSTLDYTDLTEEMGNMSAGVKKALHIDFGESFERARELILEAKRRNLYVGGLFIKILKIYHV